MDGPCLPIANIYSGLAKPPKYYLLYYSTGHSQSQQLVSERGSSLGGIMAESYSGPMIKLTTTNYSLWKCIMEDLLNCKDLYDPIEGDSAKSSDMSDVDWKKLKKKILGAIL